MSDWDCRWCATPLAFVTADGTIKLRVPTKLVAFRKGHGEMRCPRCGADTKIPVKVHLTAPVAGAQDAGAGTRSD